VSAEPLITAVAGVVARADKATVTFRLADPPHALAGIALRQDLPLPRTEFRRAGDDWELVIGRPPVNRLEYLLELRYPGGRRDVVPDPGNPLVAAGAFGPKSVLELPGYRAPGWLDMPVTESASTRTVELPAPDGVPGAAELRARIWSPAGTGDCEPLPLLVVHDGPEYDALADLTRYLSAGLAGRFLPRLRAALLAPGPRNDWYSANPRYARALRSAVIPALTGQLATTKRIGMGTSLGALAMLHAHCLYPGAFDALFLQSGSFFTQSLDAQERSFPHYRRITRFTARVHAGALPRRPVPTVLTCGAAEENAANNRLMTATMTRLGYPVTLHEGADLHNYTAWRDAFDPDLSRLLREVAG
jgi:enterochelin esterase family protein